MRAGAHGGSFPPSPELGARTRFIAADNETPRRFFAAIEVGGMLVSDDEGRHWTPAVAGLDDPDVHQILPSSPTRGLVVAACGEGIYRSLDPASIGKKLRRAERVISAQRSPKTGGGAIYLGLALGRPNTWLAQTARRRGNFRQQ